MSAGGISNLNLSGKSLQPMASWELTQTSCEANSWPQNVTLSHKRKTSRHGQNHRQVARKTLKKKKGHHIPVVSFMSTSFYYYYYFVIIVVVVKAGYTINASVQIKIMKYTTN